MEGGNLLNVRRGSNPRQPCNLATQQVSWPSTSRTNNQVADLQAQVVALQGDMATLQALLAGVTRSGDDLTFPRHVTAGLDVNARNVLVTNNVLADGSVSADNNVIAGVNLDVGNNAFVDGSVFADDDGDGTGDFVDNGTPLNVP